jgi:flagellar biosynthetic protein FliR
MSLDLLHVSAQLLTAFLLLFGRCLGLFVTMPVFGETNVPWQAKVGVSLLTAFCLLPAAHSQMPLPADNLLLLGLGLTHEMLIGISLGYLARLMLGAFQFAVNILDFMSGLSFAQMVDPANAADSSVLATFINTFVLLMFLETDGHHLLLRALGRSVALAPLGYGGPPLPRPELVAEMFGHFVQFGVQLALPTVLVLLTIDIGLGIVGKVVPTLNVHLVALPIKMLVTVSTLAATLPLLSGIMSRLLGALGDGYRAYIGMMG